MYDPLTSTYSFACPRGPDANVPLSAFRFLERLPAAVHPAVYHVLFECRCGKEHVGLVSHEDLDWASLGTATHVTFRNLLTSHDDSLAASLPTSPRHGSEQGSGPGASTASRGVPDR